MTLNTKQNKILTIFVAICSFIPFIGIIISWFSKYNFVKYPLYAVYHALICSGIISLIIKHYYL